MFKTVIVPLDGSELSEAALPVAVEVAQKFDATLLLLRTVEDAARRLATTPGLYETPGAAMANVQMMEEVAAAERKEATDYLTAVQSRLAGVRSEVLMSEGSPAEEILQAAEGQDAGIIVMSSHGRGGLGRLLRGSVADEVLRKGTTPLLLIRHKQDL